VVCGRAGKMLGAGKTRSQKMFMKRADSRKSTALFVRQGRARRARVIALFVRLTDNDHGALSSTARVALDRSRPDVIRNQAANVTINIL